MPPITRAPSCSTTTLIQAATAKKRAERGRQRDACPAPTRIDSGMRKALGRLGLAEAQHDHRQVRDRERDHRAEGEHAGEELHVVRQRQREARSRPAMPIATYGVPRRGCSRPAALGIWRFVASE